MIAEILRQLRTPGTWQVDHLKFRFTPEFETVRRAGPGKLVELVRVVLRLIRLRMGGPIDLMIYPSGGPQTVPIVRDLLLMPWMLLLCRRVVVHFHAAGIADRWKDLPALLRLPLVFLHRRCTAAIVMAGFNRRDPETLGIGSVAVLPHRIPDEAEPALIKRGGETVRFLYVGHLCPDKGTSALLRAFGAFCREHPSCHLDLAGEPLPPYSLDALRHEAEEAGCAGRITLWGVQRGEDKKKRFAQADLFIFPSVAPYESFGLVLAEAMMWSLPLIVSDWRGNREVAGADFGGWIYSPRAPHDLQLREAMQKAVQARGTWGSLGEKNRAIFTEHYSSTHQPPALPSWAARLLDGNDPGHGL